MRPGRRPQREDQNQNGQRWRAEGNLAQLAHMKPVRRELRDSFARGHQAVRRPVCEGVLAMPRADALRRIEELRVETDRISEGIRDDIEPREREEAEREEG